MTRMTALALIFALAAGTASAEIREAPRAMAIFADQGGYADLTVERHGTPASPLENELGLVLVLRMFRNVCLGIEAGRSLNAVAPEGFDTYTFAFHGLGVEGGDPDGPLVLSSTGDIVIDEEGGHPAISIRPDAAGAVCTLIWNPSGNMSAVSRTSMAQLLSDWLPYSFALVRASRADLVAETPLNNYIEWDRPCFGAWCGMSVIYDLDRGYVSISTTLNVTGIEGTRP